MRCPRCVQKIHRSAAQCPHCGFALSDLDDLYGADEVRLKRLTDMAGALRLSERRKLEGALDEFQVSFPQLFFSVYYGALEDRTNIRQFGMWLLNHAAYDDLEINRPNDGGILLLVDLNTKVASITFGYLIDPFLTEEDTFNILAKAHPHLLQGNHLKAALVVARQLSHVLKRKSRQANRHPESFKMYLGSGSGSPKDLERIRVNKTLGPSLDGKREPYSQNKEKGVQP
ncbi:MAG: TPM domain-containing protein [Akkermansiaceae bacterium]|nr:TPM domain-containing protein [Akkermansiaceae bacterium]